MASLELNRADAVYLLDLVDDAIDLRYDDAVSLRARLHEIAFPRLNALMADEPFTDN